MTRNKKTLTATGIAAIFGVVAVAGMASAHDRGGRGGGGHQSGMMGGMMNDGGMQQMMAMADADKDGKISRGEIEALRDAKFTQFDADNNGELNLDEFAGLLADMTRPRTVRMFQHLDPNGDAAISKDEIDSRIASMIEHMDRDDDGVISKDDRRGRGGNIHHGGERQKGEGRGHGMKMNDADDDNKDN